MEAIGYDRDFDEVLAGARGMLHPPTPCGRWRDVTLRGDILRVPAGVGIDLGGIAKGWTADLAATGALETGLPWVVVNAGGDLRILGDAPAIDVAIEDPEDRAAEIGRLSIREGGLATSSIRSRSWGPGIHHVIDPTDRGSRGDRPPAGDGDCAHVRGGGGGGDRRTAGGSAAPRGRRSP